MTQYISVSRAAQYLGCSIETVRRYLEGGKLDGFQPGGKRGWWKVSLGSVLRKTRLMDGVDVVDGMDKEKKVHKLHKRNSPHFQERVGIAYV